MTFSQKAITFHKQLNPTIKLKNGVSWIRAYENETTMQTFSVFMEKFYNDENERVFLFGINPGRFGAGVTGVAFTDPILLDEKLGIANDFERKHELSALFIHDVVEAYGGAENFFSKFYITSLNPVGLLKEKKNYNYYDDATTLDLVEPFIIDSINKQIQFGCNKTRAYSIGQGKNFKIFKKLNAQHKWFEEVLPLPHPRWVMQYRRKRKDEFVDAYIEALTK